jgi:uncharacterized protein (DUF1800 family)
LTEGRCFWYSGTCVETKSFPQAEIPDRFPMPTLSPAAPKNASPLSEMSTEMTLSAVKPCASGLRRCGFLFGLTWLALLLAGLGRVEAQTGLAMDLHTWPAGSEPTLPANVGLPNGPDGLNDLWQLLFEAWELAPGADNDGDGASNAEESSAGTDPFSGADHLKVKGLTSTDEELIFSFDTKAGKKYRILSDPSPGGAFTTVESLATTPPSSVYTAVANATGATIAIPKPASSARFFRIEASDADTNNDGVSDWIARQLGYDPGAPSVDLDGNGTSDLLEDLVAQFSAPDEVEVVAVVPFAFEDGPESGSFEVRRTRNLFPASVNLSYSGTAAAGADFSVSPSATVVNFAPGETSKSLFVNPNPSEPALLEGSESVTVSIANPQSPQAGGRPSIGLRSSATVILHDSTAPQGSGLLARYYDHSSATLDHAANFGDLGNYTFTLGTPNTSGTIVITPTTGNVTNLLAAITPGSTQVRLSFNGGNLNAAAYNHRLYLVTAKTATNFTCAISSGTLLPASSSSNLNFSIEPLHTPVIERVDATVDNEWMGGTPNGNFITPLNLADNWSSVWEGYLHPTTASTSGYRFQLDADDKARVLIDLNRNGSFDLPAEQVIEHGWDTPATVGTFKVSAYHLLAVPANASERYRIRVEQVETTGDARCRLQWSINDGNFGNIPQSAVYSHARTMDANYNYTRTNATAGAMAGTVVVTLNGHGLAVGNPVKLSFSSGNLFTPANGNFHGTYTVSAVNSVNTFTVPITGASLPASGAGAGFVLDWSSSTMQAWYNVVHQNLDFSGAPGRIGTNNNGSSDSNNGFYGTGTPDGALINPDSFSARWTGQVQPQFTEEYTFSVLADDGFRLWINGQEMPMTQLASGNAGGATYTYNSTTGETLVNYAGSNILENSFGVGDIVRIDPTGGTLTNLATTDLVVTAATATTLTVVFPTGMGDQTVAASANLDGQNRVLKPWVSNGNERFCRIPMVGGVRYDIRLDYYEAGGFARCRLFWFSPSQPKQVIPASRLYPSSQPSAPSIHLTQSDATALVGGLFNLPVAGSNGSTVTLSGLPAWLSFVNGELTGTPPAGAAGLYQILVTLTNAAGTSQSVVNLEVKETGGAITRELWTGLPGDTMSSFPSGTNPSATSTATSLEAPTNSGDDYAQRLRGYLTAPETGNYYFWIAGGNAAELWISNDAEPVNAFRRARVVAGSPTPQTWTIEAGQKSPWMALEQGKRYYIEIRHKAGSGPGDNLAVGWSRPGEATNAPSEVVPGHVLSPWSAPVVPDDGGTIWSATLRPQSGAVTNASGSSFLRLNAAETEAIITANYTGLTSAFFGMHVHNDMIPGGGTANIIADLEEPGDVQILPDGTFRWVIKPTAGYSVADLVQHLKDGKVYFKVHSVNYPLGEIKGYYSKLEGAPAFIPPAEAPAWTDDSNTDAGAARFLAQATFGASAADIQALKSITPSGGKSRYELWIENQFAQPASQTLPEVLRTRRADAQGGSAFDETLLFNSWWRNSVSGSDQLRQRIAFALSQIHVVSAQGPLDNRGEALAYFYDQLNAGAFGNFRDILETTTLTPTMGRYLDMLRNDKPDLSLGRIPNENYAREIKQLFSIGLFRMWPDGTLILNSRFEPIDTYSQREIVGFAHVFTGWDYGYDGVYRTSIGAAADWMRQMREVPARHFTGPKRLLNNEVLPGLEKVGNRKLDPYANHGSMEIGNADFQSLPARELDAAHDQLFENPNTGPFICRQLIQRMVTSHPSRGYVYRVTSKFNDNGNGVRGDMQAVIKSILLDYEARSGAMVAQPEYGKQREPLLRLTAAGRALRPSAFGGTYTQSGTRTITVNTSAPHNLASGNNIFLDFTAGDANQAPWTGAYSATVTTATQFTVNAINWANGTYSIPANSTVCTVTMSNHWLQNGQRVFMDFTSGAADGSATLDRREYLLTSASAETGTNITFTFTVGDTSASVRSGNCMIPRFNPGSYTVGASGLPAPNDRRVTMRTNEAHHLAVGDRVQLNIFGGNPQPADLVATVESVVDLTTWTFLVSSSVSGYGTNQGNNSVYQFPLVSQPVNRSGTINSRSSTYQLGNTDGNLEQSPLNADTVFNFFLPDYKFPGELAGAGLTTPEFQLTSETTTVRQANFLFNGVFNPGTTNGFSSFSSGSNALVMDYSTWMTGNAATLALGAPSNTGVPWTHNQNLAALVDQFATLLTANQMTPAAKQIVLDFVGLPIASIGTGTACVVNTVRPHGYTTGQTVFLSGVNGGTFSPVGAFGSNSTGRTITVVDADTFTVTGVGCTAAPSGAQVADAHASQVAYDQGSPNPSATQRRDRIRSILHLILTSPDFSVQR